MVTARAPKHFSAVGKRKTSIARIFLKPGEGKIAVNDRELPNYFGRETLRMIVNQPFEVTGTAGKFDVQANLNGGGPSGQAEALRHAISRALLFVNADYRKPLRRAGLLTRDAREVERKKYGHRGARRRPQYSKR
ncbi:MAG: 30S ribosomal protein S9 [Deltaproteobacteria bacterium]|nr:30S ribosomal protein S9 [Deltaproteobacteria bacterium]MBI2501098.1 30S ribosomal protein S9 [Deltaproteobacteria bacterium]MBI4196829.1 30S ribosomal protein S9 [Deltaproteobacteria bacterium]